jgi:Domain of unknown function (DUF1843)
MSVKPYGPSIQQAVAKGDVEEMRAVAGQVEEHLAETGNVAAALEALRVEIAKAERRSGSRGARRSS